MSSALAPSIERALRGLSAEHSDTLQRRYARLLPLLKLFLRPSDIARRNRTWPGSIPEGGAATKFLSPQKAPAIRKTIDTYSIQHSEDNKELWQLFRAYCRYGPIGLIEALSTDRPSLVPESLQELAHFHRLAKHPRAEAGLYICQHLTQLAQESDLSPLPRFVARYAWATDRKIERWFFSESLKNEHVSKTTRRIVSDQAYPHERWIVYSTQLAITCNFSKQRPFPVQPWLVWIVDEHTNALMGFRLCAQAPTSAEIAMTLRWSIWHFGAAWWPNRGAPEHLVLPEHLACFSPEVERALSYLHITTSAGDKAVLAQGCIEYVGWPSVFAEWIDSHVKRAAYLQHLAQWTLTDWNEYLHEYILKTEQDTTAGRTTPTSLQQMDVSLPWSDGIASALLLPSTEQYVLSDRQITLWDIPYKLPYTIPQAQVCVHYDPDDARKVYIIAGAAQVIVAKALAFEHHLTWDALHP